MEMNAKKNVLMKLIEAMADDDMKRIKPSEDKIGIMKIEMKPKEMEDEPDTDDMDIREMLSSKDTPEEDMSELDRFKKKYQKA